MSIGNKRKRRLSEFTIKEYGINGILIAVLFLFGLYITLEISLIATFLYLVAWVASYFVLYALTCRTCKNYGQICPVPLQGSCVNRFFDRGKKFGLLAGAGVVLAGGGVKGGYLFGESDRMAAYPIADAVTPGDLSATLFKRFGIDPKMELHDPLNRPFPISPGDPIMDLFV